MESDYKSVDEYYSLSESLAGVIALLACDLVQTNLTERQKVHIQYMAKSVTTLKGVFSLWNADCFDECYVLQRCMADRVFHLHDLIENNRFQHFEEFSFCKLFEARDKLRANPELKYLRNQIKDTKENRARYHHLKKAGLKYKRPKAKVVATNLDMKFLYDHGYDIASMAVHPMYNDGEQELQMMINPEFKNQMVDKRDVIHNSLLYAVYTINKSMGDIGFRWCKPVIDFFDQTLEFLKSEESCYEAPFLRIVSCSKNNMPLCQPIETCA